MSAVILMIADSDWNPASGGRRRREMTDEQREALSERARHNFQKETTK